MSLPGPESHGEDLNSRSEGITPGPVPEPLSGYVGDGYIPGDGHDEWCEADYVPEVHRYHPCGCADRMETGDYPDGQRDPQE